MSGNSRREAMTVIHRSLFIVSTLFIAKILASTDDEAPQACVDLLEDEKPDECCESLKIFKAFDVTMDECTQKDSNEFNCDDYTCVLKKNGLLSGEKIDEVAAQRFFAGIADEYPEEMVVIDSMGIACFNEKYNNYEFVEETCPAISFYMCSYINVLLECNSWKQTEHCKNMTENAKNCKAEIEKS